MSSVDGHNNRPKARKNGRLRLAIVSTYPPRRCGLGTFSKDLRNSLLATSDDFEVLVAAIDREGLTYSDDVAVVIDQDDPESYRKAARDLKARGVDVVLIQHEYGIFGGESGVDVLELADELNHLHVPYVVTLHTVLSQPNPMQRTVLHRLCAGATKVTVFTDTAKDLAVNTGAAEAERIEVVHHGSPEVLQKAVLHILREDEIRDQVRDLLKKLEGRRVISTFGLIGPGKGLETAIAAMPHVARAHPDVCYVIAGATHPEIVRQQGEEYRDKLREQVTALGVDNNVIFLGEYLTAEEVACVLGITDLYVTPYRQREQICSGALTFAVAAGCPIVSTPYFYAEDLCQHGVGHLVPFEDAPTLAKAIAGLLANPKRLAQLRRSANEFSTRLTWSAVGQQWEKLLRSLPNRPTHSILEGSTIPPLRLDHLSRITTKDGIVQFSCGSEPDFDSGYCVDDVTRLAVVAVLLRTLGIAKNQTQKWLQTSMTFLEEAFDPVSGAMRNMRTADMKWLDEPHLGDHIGRTFWTLGDIAEADPGSPLGQRALRLAEAMAPTVPQLPALRPAAEVMIGLARIPRLTPKLKQALESAAYRLDSAYSLNADKNWPWFENMVTYDNARLPQAMIVAGHRLRNKGMILRGLRALDWYAAECGLIVSQCRDASELEEASWQPLRIIGNKWLSRERPASGPGSGGGDEQPLDATALVEALIDAWRVTGDDMYASAARRAFNWFLGANDYYAWLYDPWTGGCHDGLLASGKRNDNMGAESTLAYYQALLGLVKAELVALETAPIPSGVRQSLVAAS